jgi:hypothetical protein
VNSKLYAKALEGVKQWPKGRCLTKKTRGQKSRETVSLTRNMCLIIDDNLNVHSCSLKPVILSKKTILEQNWPF